jgi:hypothetical protein
MYGNGMISYLWICLDLWTPELFWCVLFLLGCEFVELAILLRWFCDSETLLDLVLQLNSNSIFLLLWFAPSFEFLLFSNLHAPLWSVLEFVTLRDEFALWIAELVRFLLDDDDSESLCEFRRTSVMFNRIRLGFVESGICFFFMKCLLKWILLWLN